MTTPHTNAEALRLAQLLEGQYNGYSVGLTLEDEAATMLRVQAQEIATLRDERDAFCTEADVLRVTLTAQAGEIAQLLQVIEMHEEMDRESAGYLRSENERLKADAVRYSYKAMEESIKADKAEIERLRTALSALVDQAGYTIGYPSSSVQAKAARAALGQDAGMLHNGMRVDPKAWPVLTDPQEIRECFERDDNESVNA